jgi:hypothetical protein
MKARITSPASQMEAQVPSLASQIEASSAGVTSDFFLIENNLFLGDDVLLEDDLVVVMVADEACEAWDAKLEDRGCEDRPRLGVDSGVDGRRYFRSKRVRALSLLLFSTLLLIMLASASS